IPVAGPAEGPGAIAEGSAERLGAFAAEGVAKDAKRGAQAAQRHARLVDIFGVGLPEEPLFVRMELRETRAHDDARRLVERRIAAKLDGLCLRGLELLARAQPIAARGLAHGARAKRHVVEELRRDIEDLVGVASFRFDLYLV